MKTEAQFWAMVDKGLDSECWNWKGCKSTSGYGAVRWKGPQLAAHRVAWELTYGEHSLQVLHKCDNRACCNPLHLFLGTQKDNMQDMIAKGRGNYINQGFATKDEAIKSGRKGGKAGIGESKRRGSPEYYRALVAKREAKRKALREII